LDAVGKLGLLPALLIAAADIHLSFHTVVSRANIQADNPITWNSLDALAAAAARLFWMDLTGHQWNPVRLKEEAGAAWMAAASGRAVSGAHDSGSGGDGRGSTTSSRSDAADGSRCSEVHLFTGQEFEARQALEGIDDVDF
jgi:hypothetical protein